MKLDRDSETPFGGLWQEQLHACIEVRFLFPSQNFKTKKMGYKNDDPCLQKAFGDERLFVLMARDWSSPQVVLEWIKINFNSSQPDEKLLEAFHCALEMRNQMPQMLRRKEFEEKGWIFVTKELPPSESACEILLDNFTEANADYLNPIDGWNCSDQVIAWKNNQRMI